MKTGTRLGAGTDANVFIFVEGDEGRTDKILLDTKSADKKEQLFERGQTNHFTVKAKDVGNVSQLESITLFFINYLIFTWAASEK